MNIERQLSRMLGVATVVYILLMTHWMTDDWWLSGVVGTLSYLVVRHIEDGMEEETTLRKMRNAERPSNWRAYWFGMVGTWLTIGVVLGVGLLSGSWWLGYGAGAVLTGMTWRMQDNLQKSKTLHRGNRAGTQKAPLMASLASWRSKVR